MADQNGRAETDPLRLGKNDRAVLDLLERADTPMGAYEILEALRPFGLRAPPQVYRALNRLVAEGRVHRIESLNAFVACDHPGHEEVLAFLICRSCGTVQELDDRRTEALVRDLGMQTGFAVDAALLEVRGRCADCRSAGINP